MGKEKLLEGGVVVGHGQREFALVEEAGQALGEWGSYADSPLDDVGEFGGMGGREDEALGGFGMFLAVGFPGMDAHRRVGVGDVAVAVPDSVHFVKGFFVRSSVTPDFLADIFNAIAAEVEEAREIVGITDVHGIGVCGDGGTRSVIPGEKVLRDDIVGVGCGDETGYGQAHALGEDAGGKIAEIAAGDSDDERNRGYRQLAISGDVVEHLREQAADVDGVRGGKEGTLIEGFVGEGLLDEALAVVESAGYFEGGNVLAQCGELFFLCLADAFQRIENDNADSRNAEKSVGHGASRVSGGGDENSERARFPADKITHEAGHEAGAKILESERGAVEEFEDVKSGRKRDQLHGKVDSLGHHLPKDFFRHIGYGERPHQAEADFGERQPAEFLELLGRVTRNLRGHVEAAIGRKAAQNSTAQRSERGPPGRASVSHNA
jgi:hypothetical protein